MLDADHFGLHEVKDHIIEYLAVRRRRADRGLGVVGGRRSGAVLALVGPPGVGKTSLGESVARAMGRKFVRVALGGVRDEAEIRGHRRTYVGALPGRIVRAISEAGTMNPVVLLDEVDKVGSGRGRRAASARQRDTHEAGVRQLEHSIARILRKVTTRLALKQNEVPVHIGPDDLREYLGRPKHTPESAERTAVPGVATGLAVTGADGDVLFVEASLADKETGSTNVTLTGQLGDVMKESAQIALSYIRSHGAELELPVGDLAERGVHVHGPAGAVPKDGPSAGIAMTTALASLLSGRPVRADVAMTGEVSLTGRVLPIGGVKQKLLAAHRAGLTTVLLPRRNGGSAGMPALPRHMDACRRSTGYLSSDKHPCGTRRRGRRRRFTRANTG